MFHRNKINIFHITPHLGGGVGKALSGILEFETEDHSHFSHKVLMLEEPENTQFVDICNKSNIEVSIRRSAHEITAETGKADIVVLHWWHHPLNAELLANFPSVPVRLIIWSHINGCAYPMLPFEFVKSAHKVIITSQYTLDNPHWSKSEQIYAAQNSKIVYGMGKFDQKPTKNINKSDQFLIGYVGTLGFSKLHPDFIDYCNEVVKLIPSAQFVLVGSPEGRNRLLDQAEKKGIGNKFEFTGYVNDVSSQLERFDVFAYPLNPSHFGTTENALLEAMNYGLPVVALNQNCEKYLIRHNETGFLADNRQHYAQIIKYLYDNPHERQRVGENAQKEFSQTFSMETNISNMRAGFSEVLRMEKKVVEFKSILGEKPYQWFLSCLGEDRQLFEDSLNQDIMGDPAKASDIRSRIKNCREILKERSKSSIIHFAKYFKEDPYLQFWSSLI